MKNTTDDNDTNLRFVSTTQQILERNGFNILSIRTKLERDIEVMKSEILMCKTLQRFFKENPDKILEHKTLGVINIGHRLATKNHEKSLELNLNKAEKDLSNIKLEQRKNENKDRLRLVTHEVEDNVIQLHELRT